MDKKKLMLLLGALVIAIGTAMAARSLFIGASAPKADAAQVPKGPKVLVAQRALPVGTIVTADSVAFQAWPKEMVQDAYFIDGEADMNKLLGTVVRYPITAGQPVTQGGLVAPGDRGFLAAALGAGMRAVTIPVSAKTGVGGFVFPGDHVDLLLTQTVPSQDAGQALKATETFLRNVRVLATDQSTETTVEEGKTVVRAFQTVTLEVTPKMAEKIQVAETVGSLSLALRSLADNQSELDQAIANGTLKIPAGATKDQEEKFMADAANRPTDGGTTFVTGGDVSRFQRRTAPSPERTAQMVAANYANMMGNRGRMQPAYGPPSSSGPAASSGPAVSYKSSAVVRVTRGKTTTAEPVGGN